MKSEKLAILGALALAAIIIGLLISRHYSEQAKETQNLNQIFSQ